MSASGELAEAQTSVASAVSEHLLFQVRLNMSALPSDERNSLVFWHVRKEGVEHGARAVSANVLNA